jgi:cytochrome c-type biogenesis protein CcmE
MNQRAIRVGLTAIVLVSAFSGLLWSTLQEGTEYYMHVEEVMSAPDDWHGKKLQLHGFVRDLRRRPNSLDYSFKVHSKGMEVPAVYTGIAPDTFKNDSEVVLKGTLKADGFHVDPNGVMAKCPSKYDPQTKAPGAPTS